ncbi:MAG: amino acid adenylation domain-containing protein [Pseudomonadales bacterium]|nr:amino acid adenylation domain-containing protein [Pseudomonadales bacterium]
MKTQTEVTNRKLPPHIQSVLPLSSTQKGMLFHSLYAPDSGVYIVQLNFVLQGPLDKDSFDQTWQQLALNHDVLRTAYAWDNLETPLQVVGRKVTIPCEHQDLSLQSGEAQQQKITDYLENDRLQGFILSKAPLLRVCCFQLANDRFQVICSYHHLLFDGWSLPLLLAQWRKTYLQSSTTAAASATSATFSSLSSIGQYGDYINWLQRQNKDAAIDFWRQQLKPVNEPTLLVNSPVQSLEQHNKPVVEICETVPHKTLSGLKKLAQQQHLTLSSIVQGAWAILLNRYCQQDTITFGLTRSGRPAQEPNLQHCIGLFITTLPMVVDFSQDMPIVAFLKQLQKNYIAQQNYEFLGQADLRETGSQDNNLFDSIVVFENYPSPESTENDAIKISQVKVSEQTHYPVSLFAIADEQLTLRLLVDNNKVDKKQAHTWIKQLNKILASFSALTDETTLQSAYALPSLFDLDIRCEKEQQQINVINNTTADIPANTIDQIILAQASKGKNKVAIVDNMGEIDFYSLGQQVYALSSVLIAQGLKPNERIGICVSRDRNMVIALLATLRIGASYIPLDPEYPVARLQHMLTDSSAVAVITDESSATILDFWQGKKINCNKQSAELVEEQYLEYQDIEDPDSRQSIQALPSNHSLDSTAYVIYTSGSTGLPKGVEITHKNLVNLLESMKLRLATSEDCRWLSVTTLSFDIAMLELLLPLMVGGTLVIATSQDGRDPERLKQLIQNHNINTLQATPSSWRMLQQAQWNNNPIQSQRLTLLSGGEALSTDLAEFLLNNCTQLWNVYGPTETTIWSGALQITPELLSQQQSRQLNNLSVVNLPVGQPLANTGFYVLNKHMQPVPVGASGELCISGEGLSPGYLNRPELNQEKFIDTAFGKLYRTGDQVTQREDGLFDYIGRYDQQIKLRGYRIELSEIEQQLNALPLVHQAAVIIKNSKDASQAQLIAFYEPNDNADQPLLDANCIREHLQKKLPAYMMPNRFEAIESLPLTANGKLDRQQLSKWELKDSTSNANGAYSIAAMPKTPLENKLLAIWQELLENPAVGIEDHFFEVGGHSLLMVNAQSKIKRQLNIEISMVDLFQHPTISSLARYLETQSASNSDINFIVSTGTDSSTKQSAGSTQNTQSLKQGRQRLAQRRRPQTLGSS